MFGASACSSCPTNGRSNSNRDRCVCDASYLTINTSSSFKCVSCPFGGVCNTGTTVDTLAAAPGFFPKLHTDVHSPEFLPCFLEAACVGGTMLNGSICHSHYAGLLCAECSVGYELNSEFQCSKCLPDDENSGRLSAAILLFIIFGGYYAHLTATSADNSIPSCIISITISLLQYNGLATRFSFQWTYPLSTLLAYQQKAAYVGSSFLSVQCSSQTYFTGVSPFYVTSVMYLFLPCFLVLVVFIFYAVRGCIIKTETFSGARTQAIAACYVLFFFLYSSLCASTFDMFHCTKIGMNFDDYYLVSDMSEQCWSKTHFFWIFVTGLPMLVLYVFGIPASAFYILKTNSDDLTVESARPFRFLFINFEPEFWYWQFVTISRQVFMVILAVFLTRDVPSQALCCILLCVCVLTGHAYARPYNDDPIDWLEFFSIITSFMTYYLGAFMFQQGPNSAATPFLSAIIFALNFLFLLVAVVMFIYYQFFFTSETTVSERLEEFKKEVTVVEPVVEVQPVVEPIVNVTEITPTYVENVVSPSRLTRMFLLLYCYY